MRRRWYEVQQLAAPDPAPGSGVFQRVRGRGLQDAVQETPLDSGVVVPVYPAPYYLANPNPCTSDSVILVVTGYRSTICILSREPG